MKKKIIGVTVGTTMMRPDWNQKDETKSDYIKNKPRNTDEPIFATYVNGSYTATIPGLTELKTGYSFVMIPDTSPTRGMTALNVNELGGRYIYRGISSSSDGIDIFQIANLKAGHPVRLMYNGAAWIIEGKPVIDATTDLKGRVPIANGGVPSYAMDNAGQVLTVNDKGLVEWQTPSEPAGTDADYSVGLEYTLSDDGKYYICTGIGTCTDTDIKIPPTHNRLSVNRIGQQAFYDCSTLTSVTIPNSVTSIGDQAFAFCSSLKNIIIPNAVTSISSHTFIGCTSLTSVLIPKSVTYIGEYAFGRCDSLTNVYYLGTEEQWSAININPGNDLLINATIRYNFAGDFLSVNERLDSMANNGGTDVDLSDYQTKTDETLETEIKEIVGAINEVNGKIPNKAIPSLGVDLGADNTIGELVAALRRNRITADDRCLIYSLYPAGGQGFDSVIVKISDTFAGDSLVDINEWYLPSNPINYDNYGVSTSTTIGEIQTARNNLLTTTAKSIAGAINEINEKLENTNEGGDYLPLSGGTMEGDINLGTDKGFAGTTASGNIFDIFRLISSTRLQVGGTYPALELKGKNERPTYNGQPVALLSDIPTYTNAEEATF